jgi:hypothetical protein
MIRLTISTVIGRLCFDAIASIKALPRFANARMKRVGTVFGSVGAGLRDAQPPCLPSRRR